jgi:hypothetical protein
MRDLYQRIGVEAGPRATTAEIESALNRARLGAEVRDSAKHILLDGRRREVYDRQHRVLTQIGALRANLGLGMQPSWTKRCPDFQQPAARSTSRIEELRRVAQEPPAEWERSRTEQTQPTAKYDRVVLRKDVGFVLAAVIVIGAVALSGRLYDETRGASEATSPHRTPAATLPPQPSPRQSVPQPISSLAEATPSGRSEVALSTPVQNKLEPAKPALPLPWTGVLSTNAVFGARVAPLEIVTRPGSGSMFLKLVEPRSKASVATMFIRDGERLTLDVPLGTFRLRYAAGETWYGVGEYFGPHTVYSEADEDFRFTQDFNGYTGYTVELYLQIEGNLETDQIPKDKFDEGQ